MGVKAFFLNIYDWFLGFLGLKETDIYKRVSKALESVAKTIAPYFSIGFYVVSELEYLKKLTPYSVYEYLSKFNQDLQKGTPVEEMLRSTAVVWLKKILQDRLSDSQINLLIEMTYAVLKRLVAEKDNLSILAIVRVARQDVHKLTGQYPEEILSRAA